MSESLLFKKIMCHCMKRAGARRHPAALRAGTGLWTRFSGRIWIRTGFALVSAASERRQNQDETRTNRNVVWVQHECHESRGRPRERHIDPAKAGARKTYKYNIHTRWTMTNQMHLRASIEDDFVENPLRKQVR